MVCYIMLSYHTAKFGGHNHCGSGVIMILVCRAILQGHMIKVSWVGVPHGKSPHYRVW